jgi:hypothetical protein
MQQQVSLMSDKSQPFSSNGLEMAAIEPLRFKIFGNLFHFKRHLGFNLGIEVEIS